MGRSADERFVGVSTFRNRQLGDPLSLVVNLYPRTFTVQIQVGDGALCAPPPEGRGAIQDRQVSFFPKSKIQKFFRQRSARRARSSVRSCWQGGAEGAALPGTVNGAFGAVSGLQNFLDFSKIEGLNFLIGNFLIAWRSVCSALSPASTSANHPKSS